MRTTSSGKPSSCGPLGGVGTCGHAGWRGGGGDHNKKVRILSVCLRQYAVFLPRPTLLESLQPVQQFIRFRHLLARASENVGVYVHAMPITGDGRLAFHTIATLLPQIGFLIIEFAVFLIDDVLDELHRRLCSDQEPVAVPIQIDELLLIRITAIHENQRRLLGNPDVRPHLAEIVQCTDVGNVACVGSITNRAAVFDVYGSSSKALFNFAPRELLSITQAKFLCKRLFRVLLKSFLITSETLI